MASSWGNSWGRSWLDSWGPLDQAQQALDPFGPAQLSFDHLRSLGYVGALSDMRREYIGRGSVGSQAALNDLRALGYTGSLSDMRKKYLEDNT